MRRDTEQILESNAASISAGAGTDLPAGADETANTDITARITREVSMGEIWWGQLGTSLRFLSSITQYLRDCRTAVLRIPSVMPWRQEFYQAVDLRRSTMERRLKRLAWESGDEPGPFILRELCPRGVQAGYWPGQSHAAYLAGRKELLINDYYVWVTGVRTRTDLEKWTRFLSEYISACMESGAVFYIEYDGPDVGTGSIEKIVYRPENYECRVFCLEAASALGNTDLPAYQAELALRLGDRQPELCAALLETGMRLLDDPVDTSVAVITRFGAAEESPVGTSTRKKLVSAVWEASILELFPLLERHRMSFISRHMEELEKCLPISNSIGHQVTEPRDLEFGTLYHLTTQFGSGFTQEEQKEISLCRSIRNTLAHNLLVPIDDVRALMALR